VVKDDTAVITPNIENVYNATPSYTCDWLLDGHSSLKLFRTERHMLASMKRETIGNSRQIAPEHLRCRTFSD
jgi:hypothetical protein